MKTSVEKKENSMVALTVTADEKKWKEAQKAEFKKAADEVEVKGFRKGKAPEAKIKENINMFEVLSKAADTLLNDMYTQAVEEHNLWPVANPTLDVSKMDEDELEVIFNIAIKPDFELPEYKGLEAVKEAVVVDDKEIEEQLKALQNQNVNLEVVDKEIENGDTAVIDFEGFKDGEPFEGGKAEAYPLEIGSGQFIPGFEEQLVGKKANDELEIEVTFPEEYPQADLAGKPVTFKVKVHEVKVKKESELDDEFAKGLNIDGVDSLKSLKEYITKDITARKEQEADAKYTNDLLKQVVDKTDIEIPQPMIDQEVEAMYQQFMQQIQMQGMNEDMFLEMTKQTIPDVKRQMEEDAKDKISYTLVLEKIAAKENIKVEEKDIDAYFEKMAAMYQMPVEQIKQMLPDTTAVEFELKMDKAAQVLKDNAK